MKDPMADPLPENIDGQKVVTHRFDHGIDWKVNVSHLIVAIVVVAVLLWLKPWAEPDATDADREGGIA